MSTQPAPPRRIGVFGGSFDPPHRGHTALTLAALAHLNLDLLLVVPTGTAWHKSRPLSAAQHRLAMCAWAFGDMPRARVDDCEIRRGGPSYTVDTLEALHQAYPGAEFFLLMGQDQAQRLETWSRADTLPQLATLCVAARAGSEDQLPEHVLPVPMPLMDVSSSAVRAAVAAKGDTSALLAPAVARYIAQHRLYATISSNETPD